MRHSHCYSVSVYCTSCAPYHTNTTYLLYICNCFVFLLQFGSMGCSMYVFLCCFFPFRSLVGCSFLRYQMFCGFIVFSFEDSVCCFAFICFAQINMVFLSFNLISFLTLVSIQKSQSVTDSGSSQVFYNFVLAYFFHLKKTSKLTIVSTVVVLFHTVHSS